MTGISFTAPGTVTTASEPGAGPAGQQYQIRSWTGTINANFGCSVSVETSLEGELYVVQLAKYPDVIASNFRQGGAKDVMTSQVKTIMVGIHAGISFVVSFHGATGQGARVLYQVVDDAKAQVILQTLATDTAAVTNAQADQASATLIASLRFPT